MMVLEREGWRKKKRRKKARVRSFGVDVIGGGYEK